MHCEPGRVYAAAGMCPVCRMALTSLDKLPWTVASVASVAPLANATPAQLRAGESSTLGLRVLDPAGAAVRGFKPLLGPRVVTLAVGSDLRDAAWLVPELRETQGTAELWLNVRPRRGGELMFVHDFVPLMDGGGATAEALPAQAIVQRLTVESPAGEGASVDEPWTEEDWDSVRRVSVDGKPEYDLRVRCNGGHFVAGAESLIRIGVDRNLQPVALRQQAADGTVSEGAAGGSAGIRGRLVAISIDRTEVLRGVPMSVSADGTPSSAAGPDCPLHQRLSHGPAGAKSTGSLSTVQANSQPTDAVWHVKFPRPGLYRVFVLMHAGLVDLPMSFTVEAKDPKAIEPAAAAFSE
jgi:hypothetical protein